MASLKDSGIDKVDDAGTPQTTATAAALSLNHGIESSSEDTLDDNYRVFKAAAGIQVDPEEARRVVRKIDWRVVSVLFGTYLLQYLDKSECLDTRAPVSSPTRIHPDVLNHISANTDDRLAEFRERVRP